MLGARALVSYPSTARVAIGFWDHGSGVFDEEDRTPLRRVIPRRADPRWRLTRSRRSRRLFFSEAEVASDAELRAMLHDDQSGGLLTNRERAGCSAMPSRPPAAPAPST